jgi:hypothetical protein
MKTYWEMEVYFRTFLTSALDGGERTDSRPGRFTPGEGTPGTHWTGGWVSPRKDRNPVKLKLKELTENSREFFTACLRPQQILCERLSVILCPCESGNHKHPVDGNTFLFCISEFIVFQTQKVRQN